MCGSTCQLTVDEAVPEVSARFTSARLSCSVLAVAVSKVAVSCIQLTTMGTDFIVLLVARMDN